MNIDNDNDVQNRFWEGELTDKEEFEFRSNELKNSNDLLTKAYFRFSSKNVEAPSDLESSILSAIKAKQKIRFLKSIKRSAIAASILALVAISTLTIKHLNEVKRREQFAELEKALFTLSNQIAIDNESSILYEDNSIVIVLE